MTDNYEDDTRQELISTELSSKFQPHLLYFEIPNLTIASQAQKASQRLQKCGAKDSQSTTELMIIVINAQFPHLKLKNLKKNTIIFRSASTNEIHHIRL